MIIRVKIIPTLNENSWVGWFGECLKVRLNDDSELKQFVAHDMGIDKSLIKVQYLSKNFADIVIPDEGYDIIMSNVSEIK